MRGSRPRTRLLAIACTAVVAASVAVASASATTSSTTANGLTVAASLSPDTVTKGQVVTQTASVRNVTSSPEHVRLTIAGPLATASPAIVSIDLAPNATFSKSVSFPAAALAKGSYKLTVTGVNTATGASAQAVASITVD